MPDSKAHRIVTIEYEVTATSSNSLRIVGLLPDSCVGAGPHEGDATAGEHPAVELDADTPAWH